MGRGEPSRRDPLHWLVTGREADRNQPGSPRPITGERSEPVTFEVSRPPFGSAGAIGSFAPTTPRVRTFTDWI
jgi:hypothetical protein